MRAAGLGGSGSRQGAVSAGDAPPIFFLRHQKENAPRPVEKKKCSAGRSAQAQTSCRRRGMVGGPLRQSGTETPSPWGGLWPGGVWDTSSFSFRCRWPVVDESSSKEPTQQPLRVPRAARSEAERAERGADQMRPCTPLTSAPAPRESAVNSLRYPAAPVGEPSRIRRHHLTSTPVARGGLLHRSALSALFFWTVHGPFSFRARPKRKWGVHCPAGNPAESPGRLITAPTTS